MANKRKAKYQRANELAKQRGFANAYQERKAKAQAKGFSSPRTQRNASELRRGIKRDYQLERENVERRARGRGFVNAKDQRAFRKSGMPLDDWHKRKALSRFNVKPSGLDPKNPDKQKTLAYFGISESKFNKIRRENRLWANEYAMLQWSAINTYNHDVDKDVHNWSEKRVGYIVYFNKAIVNEKTNYGSLVDDKGYRIIENGKPKTNAEQFYYLVMYTDLFGVEEFEARYGIMGDV